MPTPAESNMGRPFKEGEPADQIIKIRVTKNRKRAYNKAKDRRESLTDWMIQHLDKAANYNP